MFASITNGLWQQLTLRWALVCLLIIALLGGNPSQAAQPEPAHFDRPTAFTIPAQPIGAALKAFADQSGIQIFYRTAILPAGNSQAINQRLTPRQALQKLLSNTSLHYTLGQKNALVIHRPEASPPAAKSAAASPPTAPLSTAIEETYVTGIRNSLRRSLALKQNAANTIEVITASDIGKFPDKNVADSLQRVAGVSVDRLWGEGRDVNIRGTDKDINRTLLNGQHVASAYWWANDNLSRGFNYSTLASQLVQSIEVHKTPRADIDEGSIGGTVIVRTRQPLSLTGPMFNASLEEHYSDLSRHWDPQLTTLGSWNNSQRTFGVLSSINWQSRRSRRDGQETFTDNTRYTITQPNGSQTTDVYTVWGGGSALLEQDQEHFTGNLTLQWAPNPHWDSVLNLLRSQMDIGSVNHNYLFAPGGFKLRQDPPATVHTPQFSSSADGYQRLNGGTLGNRNSTGALLDAIYRQGYIDTDVIDWDTHYTQGPWQVHGQLGHTQASGGTDHDYLYRFLGDTRTYFALTPNSLEVNYLDLEPTDASALTEFSADSRDLIRTMRNREYYGQLDISYQPQSPWLQRLKAGIKQRDHEVTNRQLAGRINTQHPRWAERQHTSLAQVSNRLTPQLLSHVNGAKGVTRYARTNGALLQQVLRADYAAGLLSYRPDTDAYYRVSEQSTAYYLSAELGGQHWQANAGLRAVSTRQRASGYLEDQLTTVAHRYHNLLPNLNLRYQLNNIVLRGSAARVMARPNYQDLAPGYLLDPTSGSSTNGNPTLNPYLADQLDLGIEWYRLDAALLSAAAFYKTFSSFIYPSTGTRIHNGRTTKTTRPINSDGVSIYGLELRWQQDIAWGFGLQSNYTYTRARVPTPANAPSIKLPGNSRDQLNLSLYYEGDRLDAQLAYNYRSSSFGEVIAGTQSQADSYAQLDGSLHWALNDRTSLSLEAINLSNQIIYIHSASGIPQGFYENGRRLMLGLRYHWE